MKEFLMFISACVTIFFVDYHAQAGECGIASDKDKAAHVYHGILVSQEDETGAYFFRDGKRCRLYTDAFKKKWNLRK